MTNDALSAKAVKTLQAAEAELERLRGDYIAGGCRDEAAAEAIAESRQQVAELRRAAFGEVFVGGCDISYIRVRQSRDKSVTETRLYRVDRVDVESDLNTVYYTGRTYNLNGKLNARDAEVVIGRKTPTGGIEYELVSGQYRDARKWQLRDVAQV